jgi:hypothetical protein
MTSSTDSHDDDKWYPHVLVVAPAPLHTRVREGWMSRIAVVDRVLRPFRRTYLNLSEQGSGSPPRWTRVDGTTWEVCLDPSSKGGADTIAKLSTQAGVTYVHTVHLAEPLLGWLPDKEFIVDMHGLAAEEEQVLGNPQRFVPLRQATEAVLASATLVVVVSNAMQQFFRSQYPSASASTPFVTMPIFEDPWCEDPREPSPLDPSHVRLVYAGGIQQWQNVDAMLGLCQKALGWASSEFWSESAHELSVRNQQLGGSPKTSFRFVPKERLCAQYARCHFGLLLRDAHPVNQVSSPTKLFEYLLHGLVPVVRSTSIGDYESHGYAYVREEDFATGFFPDASTRQWMIEQNRGVVLRLGSEFGSGQSHLLELISGIVDARSDLDRGQVISVPRQVHGPGAE